MTVAAATYSSSTRPWNALTGEVVDPIEPDEARRRHDAGEPYGVVVPTPHGPAQVVVLADKVLVSLHDETGAAVAQTREWRVVHDRLWLLAVNRHNGGRSRSRAEAVAEWFRWDAEGATATWSRFDDESPRGRRLEARDDWDAAVHWFDRPSFGDYDALLAPDLLDRAWPGLPTLPWLGA